MLFPFFFFYRLFYSFVSFLCIFLWQNYLINGRKDDFLCTKQKTFIRTKNTKIGFPIFKNTLEEGDFCLVLLKNKTSIFVNKKSLAFARFLFYLSTNTSKTNKLFSSSPILLFTICLIFIFVKNFILTGSVTQHSPVSGASITSSSSG